MNTQAKHTPGPWQYDKIHNAHPSCHRVLAPDGEVLADYRWLERFDEAEANARLIAAAPELLEACEWAARGAHHPACPIATGKGQTQINWDDCICHVKAARAAIAKVKGR